MAEQHERVRAAVVAAVTAAAAQFDGTVDPPAELPDVPSHVAACADPPSSQQRAPLCLPDDSTAKTLATRDLVHRLVEHAAMRARVFEWEGREYILPAQCRFAMSALQPGGPLDGRFMQQLLGGQRYHLVVCDPPWSNKSVRRGRCVCRCHL